MSETITITLELPPEALLWVLGTVAYLAGAVVAAVVSVRRDPPPCYDASMVALVGATGLIWPMFLATALLFLPLYLLGRVALLLSGRPKR